VTWAKWVSHADAEAAGNTPGENARAEIRRRRRPASPPAGADLQIEGAAHRGAVNWPGRGLTVKLGLKTSRARPLGRTSMRASERGRRQDALSPAPPASRSTDVSFT